MNLKKCSCRSCRRNRRAFHEITRTKVKGARAAAKVALKKGREPKVAISIGYTD